MRYHIIAFFLGFLLDLALGDPSFLPHPIRLIGKMIARTEKRLRKEKTDSKNGKETAELRQGMILAAIVLVSVTGVSFLLIWSAYRLHPWAGMALECMMTYRILAVKCLRTESMKVRQCLKNADIEQARAALSMIVGRDTEKLDEEGIVKAAVETVAENTSDGVVAPMLYLAIGGPVLGFFYKAVNTMDSMIGYKNDKYLYFGRGAAKLDDVVNFLPARISACFMLAASHLAGRCFSGKGAFEIYKRDRRKHKSPNAGQTEAVCAGALGIQLGGDASYFGKIVRKPYIGEALRKAEHEDIKRINRLMYVTAWLCEGACLTGMLLLACFL